MAKAIMDLINKYNRDPKTIRIDHKVLTVPAVEQAYYEIRGRSKTEALTRLIDLHHLKLGIIFVTRSGPPDRRIGGSPLFG